MANKLIDTEITKLLHTAAPDAVPVFTPAPDRTHDELLAEFTRLGVKHVPMVPFPADMVFYQMDDDTPDGAKAVLMRLLLDFDGTSNSKGRATHYFTGGSGQLILVGWRYTDYDDKPMTVLDRISYLVHEVHHGINMVFAHAGQRYDTDNDEFTAYMHEYFTRAALRAVGFGESDLWRTNTGI